MKKNNSAAVIAQPTDAIPLNIRTATGVAQTDQLFNESTCLSVPKWVLDNDEWALVDSFEGNNQILPPDMQEHLGSFVKLDEFLGGHKQVAAASKSKQAKPAKGKPAASTEFKDAETDEDGNPLPRVCAHIVTSCNKIKITDISEVNDPYSHACDESASHDSNNSAEQVISPFMSAIYSAILFASGKRQYFEEIKTEDNEERVSFLWSAIHPKTSTYTSCYNPKGKYCVKLFMAGSWRKITVDDKVPVDKHGKCMLLQSSIRNEIWPLLLSKALLSLLSSAGVFVMQKREDAVRVAALLSVCALTGWPVDSIAADVQNEPKKTEDGEQLPPLVLQTNKLLLRILGGQTPVYLFDDEDKGGDIVKGFPKPLPSRASEAGKEKVRLEPRRERKLREQRESAALDQRSGIREETIDKVDYDLNRRRKSLFIMYEQPGIQAPKRSAGTRSMSMMSTDSSISDIQATPRDETLSSISLECPYRFCTILAVRVNKEYLATIESINNAMASPHAEVLLSWKVIAQESDSLKPLPRQVEVKWTPIRRLMQFVSRGGCIAEFCTLKDLKYSSTIHHHQESQMSAEGGGYHIDECCLQPSSILIDTSTKSSSLVNEEFRYACLNDNKDSVTKLVLCVWRDRSLFRAPIVNLHDYDDNVSLIEEYPQSSSQPSFEYLPSNESSIKLVPSSDRQFSVSWLNRAMIPSNLIAPVSIHQSYPCSFVSFDIPTTSSHLRYFRVRVKSSSGVCVTLLSDSKITAGSTSDLLEHFENCSVHRQGSISAIAENVEVPLMSQELKRSPSNSEWIIHSLLHTRKQAEQCIFRLYVFRSSDMSTVYDGPATAKVIVRDGDGASVLAVLTYNLTSSTLVSASPIKWLWDLSSPLIDSSCKCSSFSNLQKYEGSYTPNKYKKLLRETITLPSSVADTASILWVRLMVKNKKNLLFDSMLSSADKNVIDSRNRSRITALVSYTSTFVIVIQYSKLTQTGSDKSVILDAVLNENQSLDSEWFSRVPFPTRQTLELQSYVGENPIKWEVQLAYCCLQSKDPTIATLDPIQFRADTTSLEELIQLHEGWERTTPARRECGLALRKLIESKSYDNAPAEVPAQVEVSSQANKKNAKPAAKPKAAEVDLGELLSSPDPCIARAAVQWVSEGRSRDAAECVAEERKRRATKLEIMARSNLGNLDYSSLLMHGEIEEHKSSELCASVEQLMLSTFSELSAATIKALDDREQLRQQQLLKFP